MEHRFYLKPNLQLLHEHKYQFVPNALFESFVTSLREDGSQFTSQQDYDDVRTILANAMIYNVEPRSIFFEFENIQTEELRVNIENSFREVIDKYDLSDHYDTLLFVVLAEYDNAWVILDQISDSQNSKVRAMELAQVLLLYNGPTVNRPNEVHFRSAKDTVKVKDASLLKWIGSVITEAFENGKFPLGFGNDVTMMFTGTENPINVAHNDLDFQRLEDAASVSIRSFKKYHRKYFTLFAFNVWRFLNATTTLTAAPDRRFRDDQLRFLYEVAILFGWIDPDTIESPPADYMSSLFSNYMRR